MEILGPLPVLAAFSVALIVLLIGFAIGAKRAPAKARSVRTEPEVRLWEDVAKGLGGRIESSGDGVRIRFKWHGRDATLSGGEETIFKVAAGSFGSLNLEILDRAQKDGFPAWLLDDFPEFCYRGDEETLRSFLSVPVRRVLRDVLECAGGRISILVHGQLRIAASAARTAKNLSRFAVLCLQLAQHARLFVEQSGGVTVVETTSGFTGVCQICGAELAGRLVRCARCSTPHHADCWEYTGVCSTYGCGGRSLGV